ncbi:hypothetical protein D9M73_239260 [compost metagenome]
MGLFHGFTVGRDRRYQVAERAPGFKVCNVHGRGKQVSEFVYQGRGLAVAVDVEGLGQTGFVPVELLIEEPFGEMHVALSVLV